MRQVCLLAAAGKHRIQVQVALPLIFLSRRAKAKPGEAAILE